MGMNKRGTGLSLEFVVVAAILLVVLVVAIVLVSKGYIDFKKGKDTTEGGLYKCLCNPPGGNNVCAFSQPTGFNERSFPLGCSAWEDCDTKCWKK